VNAVDRMIGDALQDVAQIEFRVDTVRYRGVSGTDEITPVKKAHRNSSPRKFRT